MFMKSQENNVSDADHHLSKLLIWGSPSSTTKIMTLKTWPKRRIKGDCVFVKEKPWGIVMSLQILKKILLVICSITKFSLSYFRELKEFVRRKSVKSANVLMKFVAHLEWNVLWGFLKIVSSNFFLSHHNCGIYGSLLMCLVTCEMDGILSSITGCTLPGIWSYSLFVG